MTTTWRDQHQTVGNASGQTGGKGGSMHFYNKSHNFYGGQGIVGAQVPVGTGLAFANKYKTPPGERMPVAIACYGDGAANQGQIWEAANMAALWKLPIIFAIENNLYGMGTSTERSSSNTEYYTAGNLIPGMRIDGMKVLSVREGMKAAKEYVSTGNGPLFLEFSTYRYRGHSISDPGTTYRTRDEIKEVRATRDPINQVKDLLVDHCGVTDEDFGAIEQGIRDDVATACARAKASKPPGLDQLTTMIYLDAQGNDAHPGVVRMPTYQASIRK